MQKKSCILLACNLQPLFPFTSTSTTSSTMSINCPTRQRQQHRSYAIVSNGFSKQNNIRHRWPAVTSANAIPTPYQIFDQKKGSKYSKQRFYELVKIYHPDKHGECDGLSYATKVERYRLIVAANDLLSDPAKRKAYDCWGAGWNGAPDIALARDRQDSSTIWGNYSGQDWRGPDGPSQNATWEDWERWYQRDAKGRQEPRFVSNSAFVSLIFVFAILGGVGQATRVGNHSMSFIEQRDALHDDISNDLRRRRKETITAYSSRDERIQKFIEQRESYVYDMSDHREGHRKLLPAPEINHGIKGPHADVKGGG
ncbi:Hsp40 co-chaperone-like protein Jid1 [Bisporella sp. PMI_857]|nr:Hsp40 co-chaperone-like protein Jid1 [Bisporella sp. PMI_857]